jgi:polysaccharide export outer membrane protein
MGWSMGRSLLAAGWLAAVAAPAGCAGPGAYVWFESLPPATSPASNEYLIGIGDVVSIHVFGHDEMTLRQRVRSDGRVSVLLIGDVEAKGKHPSALKAELEGRLKDYFVNPSVVVNIEETQPLTVLIMGEVSRPGSYALDLDPRLAHALALGGGLTDYASRSSIYVVRSEPTPMRVRFNFVSISRNVGGAADFQLHRGDLVEVE